MSGLQHLQSTNGELVVEINKSASLNAVTECTNMTRDPMFSIY